MKLATMKPCNPPLFIIGNPRSGTSLLRLILTSHPELLIPPECGFILWLKKKYGDWAQSDCSDPARLSNFLDDLFASKKFDTWSIDRKILKGQIEETQPRKYQELCEAVYDAYGLSVGRCFSVWGDKNNFHVHHLDEIFSLYEDARFLHIVRDGRDVACSYREVTSGKSNSPYAPNLNTEIMEVATEWANNVMKVDSFISSIPGSQGMTIKYEELVVKPLEMVKTICDWLGLQFEPEMLNFYQINREKNLEPVLTMDWKKRTMQPISDEQVGRYKKNLSLQDLLHFESVASHALARFDYV